MFEFDTISTIQIILTLAMLGIASFQDLKRREVSDVTWIPFGAAAVVLFFFSINGDNDWARFMQPAFLIPSSLIFWRIGFFGGADAFALIIVSVLLPPISYMNGIITPFTILINSILLSLVMLIVNFGINISSILKNTDIFDGFAEESKPRRIAAMFLGHWSKSPRFGFPMEAKEEDGKRRFVFSIFNADTSEFAAAKNAWVTPGIPFLVFMLGGAIIQVLYGDILFGFFISPTNT